MKSLIVPGTLDSLETIRAYIYDIAGMADLAEKSYHHLCLAVDEIATNIVTHGYAKQQNGMLYLQACMDGETLTILIEDTGTPYHPDPNKVPDDLNLPLEQRQIGGLGLYLVINSVDEFLYKRVGNRNQHTLVVKRTASSSK